MEPRLYMQCRPMHGLGSVAQSKSASNCKTAYNIDANCVAWYRDHCQANARRRPTLDAVRPIGYV